MGILSKLFGKKQLPSSKNSEHSVIVHFQYGSTDLQRLFDLENQLESAINEAGVGVFDGNVIAADGSDGYLYMYGPDADKLFEIVEPILEATDFTEGATVKLRYGPIEYEVPELEKTIHS